MIARAIRNHVVSSDDRRDREIAHEDLAALTAGCHRAGSPSASAKSGAPANNGVPTVSDIMQKVNKRKDGLHSAVGEALKADPVDWPAVQKETKEYAALAEFLGKNDPPHGDKASWGSLTKEYAESARALHAAAEKQDKMPPWRSTAESVNLA
jgi:hypothetical protein